MVLTSPFRWIAAMVASGLSLVLVASSVHADVKLPAVFGDGMVLQQGAKVKFWGWAEAGENVTVSLGQAKGSIAAGADGKWSLELAPPPAGGPYEVTVAGKNSIALKDVLVGEVWICSGQSNMEWSVNASANPEEEKKTADFPKIRLFTVGHKVSKEPQADCNGKWTSCSPQSIGGFSAVGFYFGRKLHQELNVPVGLIQAAWGGTICEAWTSRGALEADADFGPILNRAKDFKEGNPNQASALFNGMINPVVPYTIRGGIWYQGESNVGRAQQYAKLFPAMIADWRKQWGQGDFPFLFVQLAPFNYGGGNVACAELWEAQLKTLKVPNTGMAVITDVGNVKDIHPKNKQEVGRRLALWALAKSYSKDVAHSGPLYKSMAVDGNKISLTFDHAEGLVAEGGKPLSHFTIAGEDGKFVAATATIEGQNVVVHSDAVPKPVAVRFAWDGTSEPNFFNKAGLPASPFRTDDFKMVTDGQK